MKVLSLAADEGGCGRYRMYYPAEVTRKLGVEVDVQHSVEVEASKHPVTGFTTVHEIKYDADVVIIQRPLDHVFTSFLKQAKRQGIATIVELDDDFESVHRKNMAYPAMFGNPLSSARWVREACKVADLVTVSTETLGHYASHGRYSVLRNCIPDSAFEGEKKTMNTANPVVGWTGTVQTHPYDLQETKGSVGKLLDGSGLRFHTVGDGGDVQRFLELSSTTPFTVSGWVDVDAYYDAMKEIDLGIVPLEISAFNQAKSALKGMEMAALGIPFVATPTREYKRLEAYGVGKLANTPGDWSKHLKRWIDRPNEMERDAKRYQEIVHEQFRYETNAHQWVSAWERAIEVRKSGVNALD